MRIVVKVGTSTLAHATGRLNIRHMEALCKTLADLQNCGHRVVLVSSGAIGMGVGKLLLAEKPTDIATKQAAAAVGQCELMYVYDKLLGGYNHTCLLYTSRAAMSLAVMRALPRSRPKIFSSSSSIPSFPQLQSFTLIKRFLDRFFFFIKIFNIFYHLFYYIKFRPVCKRKIKSFFSCFVLTY